MDNLSWDDSYSSALRSEIPMAPYSWSNNLDGLHDYETLTGKLEQALCRSNLELQEILDLDQFNQLMDYNLMQNQQAIAGVGDSFVDASLWGEATPSRLCCFPRAAPEEFQGLAGSTGDDDGVSAIFSGSENIRNLSSSGNISSGESEALSQCTSNVDSNKRKFDRCNKGSSFQISFEDTSRTKRSKCSSAAATASIDFRRENRYEPDMEAIVQVKEMIYRAAALRPVNLGREEAVEKPRRNNVRISSDPQTVAARHRRERISERLRVLQRLVPGGSKMDTASMLDEAANYLKFLKSQVSLLEAQGKSAGGVTFPRSLVQASSFPMQAIVNPPQTLINLVGEEGFAL